MSAELETLKRSTAELQSALQGIRDSAAGIAYFGTELEHTLRVLRQARSDTDALRRKRRRAAFGWALLGGLLGGLLVLALLAQAVLGL